MEATNPPQTTVASADLGALKRPSYFRRLGWFDWLFAAMLAAGAGSVILSHVNDAGFWMVREYFGLELKQTLWVWSVLQTLVSVTGLAGTLLLSLWL